VLAWAETERYKFKILGVTDVCRAQVGVRTGYRAACSGYGRCAGTRERVENPRVEACALRGASEHGEESVRELARRVQIEAQSHVKDFVPSLVVCVNAAGSAIRVHSGRNERRARWRTASKHASLASSMSPKVCIEATRLVVDTEPRPVERSAPWCRST